MNRIAERMKRMADSPSEMFDHFAQKAVGEIGKISITESDYEESDPVPESRDYPGEDGYCRSWLNADVVFGREEIANAVSFPMDDSSTWNDFVNAVKQKCSSIKNHEGFNDVFQYGLEEIIDGNMHEGLGDIDKDFVKVVVSSDENNLTLAVTYEIEMYESNNSRSSRERQDKYDYEVDRNN